ncbi:hypothetical protein D1007_02957 [Hordeum vulgare]|uniref:Predicted protein n=1 Tax=Hordeum vulgare subsp. vulgare TaxID=112509 RepID=F2E3C5_HORVV|nr:FK506-binding protein 5-like [Hordeum vulgare subsp. vulgare]KAE8819203.1 hypothetical protein D1007_02957 [Hordeum vulgare]KAI5021725.1 hypothetical protein ZWY2020_058455 [Hordeum vulgare]BAK01847.1 predicted protein [Hordeum vulgare subsp. vulgare]
MAGGGNRRGAGAEEVRIGSGNVFAALETLKKKKKKPAAAKKEHAPVVEKTDVFWAPAPLTTKSWADVEDDDDDDYFATTAPLCPVRETQGDDGDAGHEDEKEHSALEEEIESEDDSLDDEVDAAAEDEHEAGDAVPTEPAVQKAVAPLVPPKDTERQLSKKELKKKELEQLDAVLAELGISYESSNATQDETNYKKGTCQAADGGKKEDASAPLESKTSKKKKAKKDKSSKEAEETPDQNNVVDDAADAEPDENVASVDIKERIKKVASMKKKKSSKEMDAAAKIAASEAAARRAKLAAAKKKDKNHYNQQPLR